MTTTINASNSGSGGLVQTADASGVLALQTAGTTALTIDASQNVGIGTSSPVRKLTVSTAGTAEFVLQDTSQAANSRNWRIFNAGNTLYFGTLNDAGSSGTDAVKITSGANLQFNSGYGSVATAYGCRAWVYYNGSQTILGSANVTSLTINGTGDVVVNLTTNMPDANYAVAASTNEESATPRIMNATQNAVNNFRLVTWNLSSAKVNNSYNYAAIFR